MIESLPFIHNEITYFIALKSARKNSRRLRLSIKADGEILLTIPREAGKRDILFFLAKSEDWLHQQLNQRLQNPPNICCYQNGDCILFLGEDITLKISKANKAATVFEEKTLQILSPDISLEAIKSILNNWYRQQALDYFSQRTAALLWLTPWVKQLPQIRLRRMKRQWGNCAKSGHITFNTLLIKASPELIDSVIIHELCHLKEFSHSPAFYQLMSAALPDWQQRKMALDAITAKLLH